MYVLVSNFVNLTQVTIIWEDGTSTGKIVSIGLVFVQILGGIFSLNEWHGGPKHAVGDAGSSEFSGF